MSNVQSQPPLRAPGLTNPQQVPSNPEAHQEQLLKAKYGGLLPKKKLIPKDHKYFDSADWQMGKQQGSTVTSGLQPKLEPSQQPPKRSSQLGDTQ